MTRRVAAAMLAAMQPVLRLLAAAALAAATAGAAVVSASVAAGAHGSTSTAATAHQETAVVAAATAHPAADVIAAQAVAAPAGPAKAVETRSGAAPPPNAAATDNLPPYRLPAPGQDWCDGQSIPHPSGFADMGGTGQDSVSRGGTTYSQSMSTRRTPLEFVCQNPTTTGQLDIQVIIQPMGADSTTFDLEVGPAGFLVRDIVPGHGFPAVGVGRRLGAWPGGCQQLTLAGIDDMLCFSADGHTLTHATLDETGTAPDGSSRDLHASLDLVPEG